MILDYVLIVFLLSAFVEYVFGQIINDTAACIRAGAVSNINPQGVVGCEFHFNVLQNNFVGNKSCEPSQEWMRYAGILENYLPDDNPNDICERFSADECFFNLQSQCLFCEDDCIANDESRSVCYIPPLFVLRNFTRELAQSFKIVNEALEENAADCTAIITSDTCIEESYCTWSPENTLQTFTLPDEIQTLKVSRDIGQNLSSQLTFQLGVLDNNRIVKQPACCNTGNCSQAVASNCSLAESNQFLKFTEPVAYGASPEELQLQVRLLTGIENVKVFASLENEGNYTYYVRFPIDTATGIDGTTNVAPTLIPKNMSGNIAITSFSEKTSTSAGFYIAEDPLNSPCILNVQVRNRYLNVIGMSSVKIEALNTLDANMERCASGVIPGQPNSISDCGRVKYSPILDANMRNDMTEEEFAQENATLGSFCVWRGEGLNELPPLVDPKQVEEFLFALDPYRGISGIIRNANCTVPIYYQSAELLAVFAIDDNEYPDLLISDADRDLNAFYASILEPFTARVASCYEDYRAVVVLPLPAFLSVWGTILLYTCYTVAAWYAGVSLVMAYRLHTLENRSTIFSKTFFVHTAIIFFSAIAIGFFIGFSYGCIPAAVLSGLYSSVPIVITFSGQISVGIALGLCIVYFDCGRDLQFKSKVL